jgi:hypothetical protein
LVESVLGVDTLSTGGGWHLLAILVCGSGEPGGKSRMRVARNRKTEIKEFLTQSVLILSVGVVFGIKSKPLTHQAENSAKNNLMVMRVGEVSHPKPPWGDLDPERDWIKLFFEER